MKKGSQAESLSAGYGGKSKQKDSELEALQLVNAELKILVVGAASVGKSSIIKALARDLKEDRVHWKEGADITSIDWPGVSFVMNLETAAHLIPADFQDSPFIVPVEAQNVRVHMWEISRIESQLTVEEKDQIFRGADGIIFVCCYGSREEVAESLRTVDEWRRLVDLYPHLTQRHSCVISASGCPSISSVDRMTMILFVNKQDIILAQGSVRDHSSTSSILQEYCNDAGIKTWRSVSTIRGGSSVDPCQYLKQVVSRMISTIIREKAASVSFGEKYDKATLATSPRAIALAGENMLTGRASTAPFYIPGDTRGPLAIPPAIASTHAGPGKEKRPQTVSTAGQQTVTESSDDDLQEFYRLQKDLRLSEIH